MDRTADFVILGAGIAGMTMQRALRGASTVLLDGAPFRYKIGESIIPQHFIEPEVRPLYDRAIGLPSATTKRGTIFVDSRSVGTFVLPPATDRTLHVGREELERETADFFGTEIVRERVESIDLAGRVVRTDRGSVRARELILDCSGPARILARAAATAREVWPVWASWAYHDVLDRDRGRFWADVQSTGKRLFLYDEPARTLAEGAAPAELDPAQCTILTQAREGIWTWQIPLFDSSLLSFGVVSRHGPIDESGYLDLVREATARVYRLRPRERDRSGPWNGFHVRNRFAWASDRFAGDGWALVGDAAFFGDPVYSVGTGFATNHALQLGRALQSAGWSAALAEAHQRTTADLFARAKRAYDSWYYGRIFSDPEVPHEVQEEFLRGHAFQAQTLSSYARMFSVAHPQGEVQGDPAVRVRGRDITAEIAALLEPGALLVGWRLARAHASSDRVELAWERPDATPLVVHVEPLAPGRPFYRAAGRLGISYRTGCAPADFVFEGQTRALVDACVKLVVEHTDRFIPS